MIFSVIIKSTTKCLPNSEILCWIDILWILGLWRVSKGGRFGERIETWKKQLAWIEIFTIVALSWEQSIVAAQPKQLKPRSKTCCFTDPVNWKIESSTVSCFQGHTKKKSEWDYKLCPNFWLTLELHIHRWTQDIPAMKTKDLDGYLRFCSL